MPDAPRTAIAQRLCARFGSVPWDALSAMGRDSWEGIVDELFGDVREGYVHRGPDDGLVIHVWRQAADIREGDVPVFVVSAAKETDDG